MKEDIQLVGSSFHISSFQKSRIRLRNENCDYVRSRLAASRNTSNDQDVFRRTETHSRARMKKTTQQKQYLGVEQSRFPEAGYFIYLVKKYCFNPVLPFCESLRTAVSKSLTPLAKNTYSKIVYIFLLVNVENPIEGLTMPFRNRREKDSHESQVRKIRNIKSHFTIVNYLYFKKEVAERSERKW